MPGSSPGMTKNCCEIDMRHDRFQAIISGANPIPPGAIRTADRRWPEAAGARGLGPRRMPARSRVPAIEGSDGNSFATPGRRCAGRTRSREPERDDFSSNRHPTPSFCLSMISGQTLRVCPERKPVPTFPDHAPAPPSDSKSPRPVSRRGLNSCDVEDIPVICPTCQISCVVNS